MIPDFAQFHSDALRKIDVSVTGDWLAGGTRDWRGEARAAEPIVAISFAAQGRSVSWSKSERANPERQAVKLSLLPYDSDFRDVQVHFSVGRGYFVSRTVLHSPDYWPRVQAAMTVTTCSFVPFAYVDGSHPVRLFALFLAGSDVKVGRNGLWRLRPKLVESVPANFRKLLTYGRKGEWVA